MIIVEGRRLFSQQVHRPGSQIEIFRKQAQHLQRQLFRANIGGLHGLIDPLVQELAKLLFVDGGCRHFLIELEAGDLLEICAHLVDVGEERRRRSGFLSCGGHRQEQRDGKNEKAFHAKVQTPW